MNRAERKAAFEQYISRYPAKRIASFACPVCGQTQRTPMPAAADDVWDSLTACSECDALFMKTVTGRGGVSTFRPTSEEVSA